MTTHEATEHALTVEAQRIDKWNYNTGLTRGTCVCGWVGSWRFHEVNATGDYSAHQARASGHPEDVE